VSSAGRQCGTATTRSRFVRHPIDRAISLYKYCPGWPIPHARSSRSAVVPHAVGSPHRPVAVAAVRAYVATSSFSEFIRHPALAEEEACGRSSIRSRGREGNHRRSRRAASSTSIETSPRSRPRSYPHFPPPPGGNASGRSPVERSQLASDDRGTRATLRGRLRAPRLRPIAPASACGAGARQDRERDQSVRRCCDDPRPTDRGRRPRITTITAPSTRVAEHVRGSVPEHVLRT